jgi:hypothetical protein
MALPANPFLQLPDNWIRKQSRRKPKRDLRLQEEEKMNRAKKFGVNLMCLSASLVLGGSLMAGPRQQNAPAPDNTKTNQGDGSKGAVTADQQKVNAADQAISKNIRSSIMQDRTLSTYAHNVKIITQDGKVTLKGPVRSDDEKANIEAKATAVAGAGNVDNQLTVAAGNGSSQ